MKNLLLFLFVLCSAGLTRGQTLLIKTVAGNGTAGYTGDGGPATNAQVNTICSIAHDGAGNVYVCDATNCVIRKVDAAGNISTIAGTGTAGYSGNGGPATAAELNWPHQIAADNAGNIYILENETAVVRKIDLAGNISIAAGTYMSTGFSGDGGPATAATFNHPSALAVDAAGNLYIGDWYNRRIRKVDASGTVTTVAGNGTSTYAEGAAATNTGVNGDIRKMTCDNNGNIFFMDNDYLRKINSSGIITTYGGNGVNSGLYYWAEGLPATNSRLQSVTSIAAADDGTVYLYIEMVQRVVKIDDTTHLVTTVAGDPYSAYGYTSDGTPAARALMGNVLSIDATGNDGFYISDNNNKVRKTYMGNFVPVLQNPSPYTHHLCVNSGTVNMSDFFWAEELDSSDTLTWSIVTPPAHGTLTATYSAPSSGGIIAPSSFAYTATTGYTGTDMFAIRVSDGTNADTGIINLVIQPRTITGTRTVCTGYNTTLSCTVAGGYWMSDNTSVATVNTTTGEVTGIAPGTATIHYYLASGCSPSATVTVNATPDPISGMPEVCMGQTNFLFNSSPGGTWQSGNTGIATVNATTGRVTGINMGVANISYRLPNGCRSTIEVAVLATPDPISGADAICNGNTAIYSHPLGTAGYWQSANTARATVDAYTGEVTAISVGAVNITYHISSGCYAKKQVTINALPTVINGPTSVCQGASITLTSSPTGGTWTSDDPSIATVSGTGVVSGVSSPFGVNISYTRANGCSRTKFVFVNTTPDDITGTAFLCKGEINNLNSYPYDGTWTSSNSAVLSIDTWGVTTAVNAGTARITYTLAGGCRKTTVVTVGAMPTAITGTNIVCVNSTATLASSPTTHTWSSDNASVVTVSPTGVLTGISEGTATISYTTAQGCARFTEVTVNAAVDPIAGIDVLCATQTTTFTNSTFGGTWSSSAASKANVNSSTGVVTGVSAGTANISYAISPGCRSIKLVSVNTMPTAITGANSVCVDATTTFTNTVGGGSWSSSNAALGTVDAATGIITGIAFGTPTISYALPNGCYRTKNITVRALPNPIAGPTSVCEGATITLTSAGTTGGSWQSSNTATATIGSTNGVVTGISGGAAIITRTNGAGCMRTVEVTVNALPNAGTITSGTAYLLGDTATISSSGATGGTWASSNAAVIDINPTSGFMSAMAAGTATVTYTVTNSCGASNTTEVFSVASMRPVAEHAESGAFTLFPNPTSGRLTVRAAIQGVLAVYAADGKLVASFAISNGDTGIELDRMLSSGTYLAQFAGNNGSTEVIKIVLNK